MLLCFKISVISSTSSGSNSSRKDARRSRFSELQNLGTLIVLLLIVRCCSAADIKQSPASASVKMGSKKKAGQGRSDQLQIMSGIKKEVSIRKKGDGARERQLVGNKQRREGRAGEIGSAGDVLLKYRQWVNNPGKVMQWMER